MRRKLRSFLAHEEKIQRDLVHFSLAQALEKINSNLTLCVTLKLVLTRKKRIQEKSQEKKVFEMNLKQYIR